jgi:HD-GYP domain-containing protein (c-di-GMP phosphodiesterase class II)
VVDVWDALRSDRPYRKAWGVEKVLDYFTGQAGSKFDPRVVECFLKVIL